MEILLENANEAMRMARQRQIEMSAIPDSFDQAYATIEGHVRIVELKTACPECGSYGVWTYIREPDLWRCVKCHRIPPAGEFVYLIPKEDLCPTCRYHFCLKSVGLARVDECSRYQRALEKLMSLEYQMAVPSKWQYQAKEEACEAIGGREWLLKKDHNKEPRKQRRSLVQSQNLHEKSLFV